MKKVHQIIGCKAFVDTFCRVSALSGIVLYFLLNFQFIFFGASLIGLLLYLLIMIQFSKTYVSKGTNLPDFKILYHSARYDYSIKNDVRNHSSFKYNGKEIALSVYMNDVIGKYIRKTNQNEKFCVIKLCTL